MSKDEVDEIIAQEWKRSLGQALVMTRANHHEILEGPCTDMTRNGQVYLHPSYHLTDVRLAQSDQS